MRAPINHPAVGANAQATEVSVKATSAPIQSRVTPTRLANQPHTVSETPRASR
jgi:hypothetical protein